MEEIKQETKETKEAMEGSKTVWVDELNKAWNDELMSLSTFKLKEDFYYDDLKNKCRVLNDTLKDVHTYIKKFEDEKANHKKFAGLKSIDTINKDTQALDEFRKELFEKARKIIGGIYNGQLIPGKIVSRNGDFYYYRKRYEIELGELLDAIIDNKDEVVRRLNSQQQKDLAYIFNFATAMGEHKGKRPEGYYYTLKVRKVFEQPIEITIPEDRDNGSYRVNNYNIKGIEYSSSGLRFVSGEEHNKDDTINIPDFVENITLEQNFDLIHKAKEELKDKIRVEKDKLTYYKNEMDDKFAKILVFRKFKDEPEEDE